MPSTFGLPSGETGTADGPGVSPVITVSNKLSKSQVSSLSHLNQGPGVFTELVIMLELHGHSFVTVDGCHLYVSRVVHINAAKEVSGSET